MQIEERGFLVVDLFVSISISITVSVSVRWRRGVLAAAAVPGERDVGFLVEFLDEGSI